MLVRHKILRCPPFCLFLSRPLPHRQSLTAWLTTSLSQNQPQQWRSPSLSLLLSSRWERHKEWIIHTDSHLLRLISKLFKVPRKLAYCLHPASEKFQRTWAVSEGPAATRATKHYHSKDNVKPCAHLLIFVYATFIAHSLSVQILMLSLLAKFRKLWKWLTPS